MTKHDTIGELEVIGDASVGEEFARARERHAATQGAGELDRHAVMRAAAIVAMRRGIRAEFLLVGYPGDGLRRARRELWAELHASGVSARSIAAYFRRSDSVIARGIKLALSDGYSPTLAPGS